MPHRVPRDDTDWGFAMAIERGIVVAGQPAALAARSATSASMALSCASIGTRTGEPGRAKARLAASSRLAWSSPPSDRWLTTWSRAGMPYPLTLVLLGYHAG